jgi:hypothetical protein
MYTHRMSLKKLIQIQDLKNLKTYNLAAATTAVPNLAFLCSRA